MLAPSDAAVVAAGLRRLRRHPGPADEAAGPLLVDGEGLARLHDTSSSQHQAHRQMHLLGQAVVLAGSADT